MSWLRKAEELLNRVDQSAAQALQKSTDNPETFEPTHKRNSSTASYDNNVRFEPTASGSSTPSGRRMKAKRSKEDELIDYLNSMDDGAQQPRPVRKFESSRMAASYSQGTTGSSAFVKSNSGSDSDMSISEAMQEPGESHVNNGELSESNLHAATAENDVAEQNEQPVDTSAGDEPVQQLGNDSAGEQSGQHNDLQPTETTRQRSANENQQKDRANEKVNRDRLKAFERENKLLKQEIEALNRECASLIDRGRAAQSDRDAQRNELTKLRNTVSTSERRIRDLETLLGDAQEALRAKDTQIGVLKVRLDEAEREVNETRNAAEARRTESEAASRDFSQVTALKDGAIDSLAAQVRELDSTLKSERLAHEAALRDAAESTRRVEAERENLVAQLNESSRRISDERFRATELSRQLVVAKHASEAVRDELEAYREKAQLLVSSKERIIVQLVAALQQHGVTQIPTTRSEAMQRSTSDSSSPASSVDTNATTSGISLSSLIQTSFSFSNDDVVSVGEFDTVRNERDALKEELRAARCLTEQLRADLQDAEAQSDAERRTLQDTVTSLEQQVSLARAHAAECDAEMRTAQRSASCAQDELHKQTLHFRARLADREGEIERLRAQVLAQQRGSSLDPNTELVASINDGESGDRHTELVGRVRSLTENLIAKQTLVETLQTEKQALRVQLERANERYAEQQRIVNSNGNGSVPRSRGFGDSTHTNVALYDDTASSSTHGSSSLATFDYDDVVRRRLPLPAFMRESLSRDTKLTRNVRKAVTTIDVFSIRLGLFLRRYPIARVFLLCYMFFLHFWVFIVLTTYQHEIHTSVELMYAPHAVDFNAHQQPNVPHPVPPLPHDVGALPPKAPA